MTPGNDPRSENLVLRPAVPKDAAAIAALVNLIGARSGGTGQAMTAEIVDRNLIAGDPGLSVLVAEVDGAVVGIALHTVAYETAFAAKGRYLSDLAVDPAHRRRGVARALLARLARLTRDEGGEFLWWVGKDSLPDGAELYRRIADTTQPVTAYAVTREAFEALLTLDR